MLLTVLPRCCYRLCYILLVAPVLAFPLQASERFSAHLDSKGRVVFTNELPAVSPLPPTSSAAGTPGAAPPLDDLIEEAADEHQVDAELIRAIIQVESNYNPYAVSPRGARGLMQLIPATARRFGVRDIFDPRANLDGGIRYLKYLMEMFRGDLRLSLAAYNAGENMVDRNRGVPPYRETQDYLRKIERLYPLQSLPQLGRQSTEPGIMKFVDSKGVVHFSNTDLP